MAGAVEGDVAQLVDDERVGELETLIEPVWGPPVASLRERADEVGAPAEGDAGAAAGRPRAAETARWGFPVPTGRPGTGPGGGRSARRASARRGGSGRPPFSLDIGRSERRPTGRAGRTMAAESSLTRHL